MFRSTLKIFRPASSLVALRKPLIAKQQLASLSTLSGSKIIDRNLKSAFLVRHFSGSPEPELICEKKDQVFFIRLNRPKKFNALTPEIYSGIIDGLNQAVEDPEVKFTVITGTGKYFSSGNDLRKLCVVVSSFFSKLNYLFREFYSIGCRIRW